jgi:hypothetical protein
VGDPRVGQGRRWRGLWGHHEAEELVGCTIGRPSPKGEMMLNQIQQVMHDGMMHVPIGPSVA